MGSDELRKDLLERCMENDVLAIEEVRKLSRALILPSNLRELGLLPSLKILIRDIQAVTALNIDLSTNGFNEELLNEEQKTALYRIVQEQMNNILKHAHASKVNIHLSSSEERVELSLSDDGKGFDTSVKRSGVGLYNISNRVELFNGSVIIDSAPGKGCRLSVRIKSRALAPQSAA